MFGSAVEELVRLIIVLVEEAPGVHNNVIIDVPSGPEERLAVKLGLVFPPVSVVPSIEGKILGAA